jgi:hypothetical protein
MLAALTKRRDHLLDHCVGIAADDTNVAQLSPTPYGNIWGTTPAGGVNDGPLCKKYNYDFYPSCGTVFKITP